jgi:hypothetical protein
MNNGYWFCNSGRDHQAYILPSNLVARDGHFLRQPRIGFSGAKRITSSGRLIILK